jgi:hypothetical protein
VVSEATRAGLGDSYQVRVRGLTPLKGRDALDTFTISRH